MVCVFCNEAPETEVHVVKECYFAITTWFATLFSFLVDSVSGHTVK